MKIGVISDTHCPVSCESLPEGIYKFLRSVDLILFCGDLIDMTVLESIKKNCPEVKIRAVRGNMDSPEVKRSLPEKEIIEAGGFKIGLTHGYGPPEDILDRLKEIFKTEKLDVVVFGHTHRPFNKEIEGVLYFNPGSLCEKIFAPYNSYGILEIGDKIEGKIIRLD